MPSPRSVLIVQPYGIGDLLFLTPVLRALRLMPGVETVDILLGSRTEAVVRNNPHVDEIFSIDKDLFHKRSFAANIKSLLQLRKKLKRRKYDLLLDYSFRDEYAILGWLFLGVMRRAGYAYRRKGLFHNIRLPIPRGFSDKHVVHYASELAERAGIPVEDRYMEFYLTDDVREAAAESFRTAGLDLSKPWIAVSPGGGESWGRDAHFKRWPARYFKELIQKISKLFDFEQVICLGSQGERAIGDEIAADLKMPARNLMGLLSLEQSAVLMERALLFLGNDGGLVHMAHAFHVPLIALYGPVDPIVYGPYPPSANALPVFQETLECRPCYINFRYKSDCEHRACLQELFPGQILEQFKNSSIEKNINVNQKAGH